MRKVFLDDLPTKYGIGKLSNTLVVDWVNSLGHDVEFVFDNIKGKIKIIDFYSSKHSKIKVKYNDKEFLIDVSQFQRCEITRILGVRSKEFKYKIGQTFKDDKRDITIINVEYRKRKNTYGYEKYYKYTCNQCGWEKGWIIEGSIKRGVGCSCCAGRTIVEGINDIPTTAPWMIPYFQGGYDEAKLYTYNSQQKIRPICPDCGRVKKKDISICNIFKLQSMGCICGDGYSFASKYILKLLEQLNLEIQTEVKYKWNKYKTFDKKEHQASIDFIIFLNNRRIPLEVDGGFHREDNNMTGQTKEESKYIDNQRDINCLKYLKEKTIRITDEGNIKENILNSELNDLFDLSNINWLDCEEFALSNLLKEACILKKKNPEFTTRDIGKIMNLHMGTIIRYLKKGNNIWDWCNYEPREEWIKSAKNIAPSKFKQLICINTGDVFKSVLSCVENSINIFNTKLTQGQISNVCLGKRKQHKGYIFKYISDLTPEEYIKYDIENKLKELHNKELGQAC